MPDVEVGDICRASAKMLLGAEEVVNVFHLRHDGVSPVSDGDWNVGVIGWISNMYQDADTIFTDDLIEDLIDTYNVTQDRPMYTQEWPGSFQGTDTSAPLPYQNCYLLTFPTAVKKSLGKKFMPGVTENQSAGAGLIVGGAITVLAALIVDILAGFVVAGNQMNVGNLRETSPIFVPWESGIVEALISTQRRRKPGVGA